MNEVVTAPSPMLNSLNEVKQLSLGEITTTQARDVARRLLNESEEVSKVNVAAFSSFV